MSKKNKPIPKFNTPIIETHCHLDYLDDKTMSESLESAFEIGVEKIVTIAVSKANLSKVVDISNAHKKVFFTQGIHPHDAKDFDEEVESIIRKNSKLEKMLAVGEIGLDYFYDHCEPDIQKAAFSRQMQIADDLDLPVVIHTREACDDMASILKNFENTNKNILYIAIKHEYYKITSLKNGKELADNYNATKQNDLTAVVYNFVDMLSHSKTEMEVIKELAGDDKAYRSLTLSWFKNSPLFEIIQKAQLLGQKLIITTDHGTINCKNPSKVTGDRNINTNLRFKTGRHLSYEKKDVYAVHNPKDIFLPTVAINSPFIFAKDDLFFTYPNNFNHFVKYYKNSYQHGGISLEEVIIPFAIYSPK